MQQLRYLLPFIVLILSGITSFADTLTSVTGTLVKHDNFESKYVDSRNVQVWLPVGYENDTDNYSVVYMHDGQNLFDKRIAYDGEWKVDEHIQKLMDDGVIRKTIVVGIWNTAKRYREYQPQASFWGLSKDTQKKLIAEYDGTPLADNYLKFIVEELKPFIDSTYRTHKIRKETFMIGSSMGGLISVYALAKYPEVFGGIAGVSTHWPISRNFDYSEISDNFAKYFSHKLPRAGQHKIYLDYGTETLDAYYEPHQKKMDAVVKRLGYSSMDWLTRKFPGAAHHEGFWEERVEIPLIFLLRKPIKFTHNAMAPLDMRDDPIQWQDFRRQIRVAKQIGIDAISVDVWWGTVERNADNEFDWNYYDKIFNEIEAAGLHWVPIMSFHRCGGYIGEACNALIPDWIWNNYENVGVSRLDMLYRSENDDYSDEAVSLWQDHLVLDQYIEFMNAFEEHYATRVEHIDEINISMGASGELRYPAYNPRDPRCDYPTRGCFQAYSTAAQKDFIRYAKEKYKSINSLNLAWQTKLTDFTQVHVPDDGSPDDGRASSFVISKQYKNSQYGRDFIDWYHNSLVDHGRRMIEAGIEAFDGAFADIEIGLKIAGIHWQMSAKAPFPRITEMAVGVIPSSVNVNDRATGFGYGKIINMVAEFKNQQKLALHFTNLEGDDRDWIDKKRAYSMARTQVNYVATAANDAGIVIKGENAMAQSLTSEHSWNNINRSVRENTFYGLTVLRVDKVTDNPVGRKRYKKFIESSKKQ